MKIRTIIIDDEAMARASLREDIGLHCPSLQLVGEADSVETAIDAYRSRQPALIFLDIQMGDGSGFDFLEAVGPLQGCSVIFTTAYDHYAIRAFRFAATDYLLKPIGAADLKTAVQKVVSNIGTQQEALQRLIATMKPAGQHNRVAIPTAEGIHVIDAHEIVRCQSESNYTHIYLRTGEKILAAKTLKDLEELLAHHEFERVHSSHLINLNHLRRYITREGGMLVLADGSEVPISQRKKAQVLDLIKGLK